MDNRSNNNLYNNKNVAVKHKNSMAYNEGNRPYEGFEDVPIRFQSFTMLILIGYFGIKIFLGAFKLYPKKYYQREVIVDTNQLCGLKHNNTQKELVMSYFVPGIWNNEIYDLIVTLVMGGIIYIFTDMGKRRLFGKLGGVDLIFVLGYIIGLNAPAVRSMGESDLGQESDYNKGMKYALIIVLVFTVILMIMFSAKGASAVGNSLFHSGSGGYILYIIMIVLLVIGLIYTRKRSSSDSTIIYQSTVDDNQCKQKPIIGGVRSGGETVHLSMTFIAWLLCLIFVNDPQENYMRVIFYFMNGIALGIFVSGMSFYGCQYLLQKIPSDTCFNRDNCKNKGIDITQEIKDPNKDNVSTVKWLLGGICCVVIALLIYLYYGNVIHF